MLIFLTSRERRRASAWKIVQPFPPPLPSGGKPPGLNHRLMGRPRCTFLSQSGPCADRRTCSHFTGERHWCGETQGASGTARGCTVDCRMRKEEGGERTKSFCTEKRGRTPTRRKPGVVLTVLHLPCHGYRLDLLWWARAAGPHTTVWGDY